MGPIRAPYGPIMPIMPIMPYSEYAYLASAEAGTRAEGRTRKQRDLARLDEMGRDAKQLPRWVARSDETVGRDKMAPTRRLKTCQNSLIFLICLSFSLFFLYFLFLFY